MTTKWRLGATIAIFVLGFILTGCSGTTPIEPAKLNAYEPSNVSFFKPASYGGAALEVENYDTLEAATRAASAVVIAKVVDVRPGGVDRGDPPSNVYRYIAIDIQPVEVIQGELVDGYQEKMTVERLTGSTVESVKKSISFMKSNLPEGLSVWFLRDTHAYGKRHLGRAPTAEDPGGSRYRLICSEGLFIQGQDSVTNPLLGREQNMVAEAQSYKKLSELVEYLRQVEGWTGKAPQL